MAEEGSGILISHTVSPYLDDFSALAAFGLEGVFSRRENFVTNLVQSVRGFSSYRHPREYIKRVFDKEIILNSEKSEEFKTLVTELISLERRYYLQAMRAIKTFIAGVYSIYDDLALSYTLMVSALESLALKFDGFEPTWADYPEQKRRAIDKALGGASEDTVIAVRKALLQSEHIAIARRYREFICNAVGEDYFRCLSDNQGRQLARYELDSAVKQAYEARSAYLHRLEVLPSEIVHSIAGWETTEVGRRPALTFQGLYRLGQYIIRGFIASAPQVEIEKYDYVLEQPSVARMQLAPQYWVANSTLKPTHVARRFEGFISIVEGIVFEGKNEIIDMRPVIKSITLFFNELTDEQKISSIGLIVLYNLMVAEDLRSEGFGEFYEQHVASLNAPTVESLIVATLLGRLPDWPVIEHAKIVDKYFEDRVRPKGLRVGRRLEGAICLGVAERFRSDEMFEQARKFVSMAVECDPGNVRNREIENSYDDRHSIDWRINFHKIK